MDSPCFARKKLVCERLRIERRPYQHSGLYAVRNALKMIGDQDYWIDILGEVGVELKAWKMAISQDMGGDENISAMERSIIDLATKTFLMLQRRG